MLQISQQFQEDEHYLSSSGNRSAGFCERGNSYFLLLFKFFMLRGRYWQVSFLLELRGVCVCVCACTQMGNGSHTGWVRNLIKCQFTVNIYFWLLVCIAFGNGNIVKKNKQFGGCLFSGSRSWKMCALSSCDITEIYMCCSRMKWFKKAKWSAFMKFLHHNPKLLLVNLKV